MFIVYQNVNPMFIYNYLYFYIQLLILQKAPKIVSAGVASVLRASRFSKHFEFQALEPGTTAPDDVDSEADPFAYCESNDVAPAACCAKRA